MREFATRDPPDPAFRDERYRARFTPWDARGVADALSRFPQAAHPGHRVPGCGSDYLHAVGSTSRRSTPRRERWMVWQRRDEAAPGPGKR